jgi:hypothetical protein
MSKNMLGTQKEVSKTLSDLMSKLGSDNGDEWLVALKRFLRKEDAWSVAPDFIDCDADPYIPDGWKVVQHRKDGKFAVVDSKKIQLYLADGQMNVKSIIGNKLHEALQDKAILNANVLDFLLKYRALIPEDWKGKKIFFWGTIYRCTGGGRCVRCLDWSSAPVWYSHYLNDEWFSHYPAALAPV